MQTFNKKLIVFTFTICGTLNAYAQKDGKTEIDKQVVFDATRPLLTNFPSGFSSLNSGISLLNLTTSKDEKSITGDIGIKLGNYNTMTLKIKTPFDDSRTEPLTIGGLSRGSTAEASFQREITSDKAYFNDEDAKDFLEGKRKLFATLTESEKAEMFRDEKLRINAPLYGFGAKFGKEKFHYTADSTFESITDKDFISWEVKGYVGVMRTNRSIWAITLKYQSKYKGEDAVSYNIPVSGTTITRQDDLQIGAPKQITDQVIKLEYRRLFAEGHVAINPNINFSTADKKASFDLPVYSLGIKDGVKSLLNGGIFFSYTTSEDYIVEFNHSNIGFGVFIASAFDLKKL